MGEDVKVFRCKAVDGTDTVHVWHQTAEGRLYESRYREADIPELVEKLLGVLWGGEK